MVFPLVLELALLIIVPVLLIYYRIIPYRFRYTTMMSIVAIVLGIVVFEGWSFERLGLRLDNLSSTLPAYLIFIVVGVVMILLFTRYFGYTPQKKWWKDPHFQYFFLVSSFLQEFIFRGFFIAELDDFLHSGLVIVLLNAIIFTFIHIIYSVDVYVLMGTFLMGCLSATMYILFPNLILITIAHVILNFLIVLHGTFREDGTSESLKGKLVPETSVLQSVHIGMPPTPASSHSL